MKLLIETVLTLGLIAVWFGVAMSASNSTRTDAETAISVFAPGEIAAQNSTATTIQAGG